LTGAPFPIAYNISMAIARRIAPSTIKISGPTVIGSQRAMLPAAARSGMVAHRIQMSESGSTAPLGRAISDRSCRTLPYA
jgi:hypothetical protein